MSELPTTPRLRADASAPGRAMSFVIVAVAYVLATAAAYAATRVTADPLVALGLATLAATVVVFVASVATNNSSLYDPYWSVYPLAAALWLQPAAPITWLVAAWSLRLTYNWARGWPGLVHEDWRYVDIRQKTGRLYWPASFFGIHLFPTVLTFAGTLPLLTPQPLAIPAFAVTLAAIVIETVADEQLRAFRLKHPAGACDVGLWRHSRHPNYFGEILFWVGLWLSGVAAGAPAWTVAGPLLMFALFWFASIPMAEKRALARRPDFARRVATVSRLVPWFRATK